MKELQNDKDLKQVNTEINLTQYKLCDVKKLFKLYPTNTELISQKYKLLG